ncbi:hypothetical protein [Achromobacter mucicolens]|uniref:hypothetical protein n=1 Tax=Achromobacter mucicolens TaxID=1389922 RepID=UPI0028ACBA31|nr:hypothetical protein [Achromobacter mucicolens]
MTTPFTPGPWTVSNNHGNQYIEPLGDKEPVAVVCRGHGGAYSNAYLIAAAPELLEALEEAADLAWIEDSHQVEFDPTVIFSEFYDFSGVDGTSRIEFHGQHECIVWPGSKWSAYCTYDGFLWFEKFDTAQEAKEACMRLRDKVMPDHPAMRARAVIRKARGET